MRSLFLSMTLLASAMPFSHAWPVNANSSLSARDIPPTALYVVEWYPNGCANGNGQVLYGAPPFLTKCTKFGGTSDGAGHQAAVKFQFPDNGQRWQRQIFRSNDCSDQITAGEGSGCFSVPSTIVEPGGAPQGIGAVKVFTD